MINLNVLSANYPKKFLPCNLLLKTISLLILTLTLPFLACGENSGGPEFLKDIKELSAGDYHTAVIDKDGKLLTWGANWDGELGDGTSIDRNFPVELGGGFADHKWKAVSAGVGYTVAIDENGKIYTWGNNYCGQLGDDTTSSRDVPGELGGGFAGYKWKAVSAGIFHTAAIREDTDNLANDGKIYTWGYNSAGQLGDGTISARSVPGELADGYKFKWKAVSAGDSHSVAIKEDKDNLANDGKIYTWGHNQYGELGDDTTSDRKVPGELADGYRFKWKAVSTSISYTVAIREDKDNLANDGKIYTWGVNYYGKLGDHAITTDRRYVPGELGGGFAEHKWKAVSSGDSHTVAIDESGKLWGWGDNFSGQMGNNTKSDFLSPVCILDRCAAAGAGSRFTIIIKDDGSVWALGENNNGQLGDGSNVSTRTPKKVIRFND